MLSPDTDLHRLGRQTYRRRRKDTCSPAALGWETPRHSRGRLCYKVFAPFLRLLSFLSALFSQGQSIVLHQFPGPDVADVELGGLGEFGASTVGVALAQIA